MQYHYRNTIKLLADILRANYDNIQYLENAK